jgi:hypothetical protein
VPYNKSKNGSSRSLSRFFSKSSDTAPPPLPISSKDDSSTPSSKGGGGWNSLTAIFTNNKRSTSNLSLPNQVEMGENPGHNHYPPTSSHTGAQGLPITGIVNWHEKAPPSEYYTGELGPRVRRSSSITRSDYDTRNKLGVEDNSMTHVLAFDRRPSDTSQDGARSTSGSFSRYGGGVARNHYLQADEELYYGRRPSTGRSSHSYSSSTFGTTSKDYNTVTSKTSLRGPVELVNPFAGGGEVKEKKKRSGDDNELVYDIRHLSYEVGRAI